MRLVFMGTPDFAATTLQALVDSVHEVVAVYTQPPRQAGRGKKLQKSTVHKLADTYDIPVFTPTTLKDEEEQRRFAALDADVAVVVAYGMLLPAAILDAPGYGCVNIHASLLPRWRGAAPIHRAIMAGDRETGICIMQMDEGLDTGPVLSRTSIPVDVADTTESLHDRLASCGAAMIVPAIEGLADGSLTAVAQAVDGVTYARKIDKAEARINWDQPADEIERLVRGLYPFPGAWTCINGERVKILAASKQGSSATTPAGTVISDALVIQTGDGALQLETLQRAGKIRQNRQDFLRGFPVVAGDVAE